VPDPGHLAPGADKKIAPFLVYPLLHQKNPYYFSNWYFYWLDKFIIIINYNWSYYHCKNITMKNEQSWLLKASNNEDTTMV